MTNRLLTSILRLSWDDDRDKVDGRDMSGIFWIAVAYIVGGATGFFTAALANAARDTDRRDRRSLDRG